MTVEPTTRVGGVSVAPTTLSCVSEAPPRTGDFSAVGPAPAIAASGPTVDTELGGAPGPATDASTVSVPSHERVTLPFLAVGVPPVDTGWSTERKLVELLGRYDTFYASALAHFESLLTAHVRATRRSEISFAFKNGGNRRYVLKPVAATGPVLERKMRRRVRAETAVIRSTTTADLSTYQAPQRKLLDSARRGTGVALVPTGGLLRLSPREQDQFSVRYHLSAATLSQLHQAGGGRSSGWASREVFRAAMAALTDEPGRRVWSDERGSHLISLRAGQQDLFDGLSSSGHFVERYMRDLHGDPAPHTNTSAPSPALPYELHRDSTADVHVCVSLDKGGRGTATSKLVLTTPNQKRPMARGSSVLLSVLPCVSDANEDLQNRIGPWASDLQELLENRLMVGGTLRAVRLFLGGDMAFLSALLGHKGTSSRCPCPWCTVICKTGDANEKLAATHGYSQAVSTAPPRLRAQEELQAALVAYDMGPNDSLPIPRTPTEHLSIGWCPLFDVYPCHIVPAPLHLTLGITAVLSRMGIEAAYAASGRAAAVAAATSIGRALLDEVRVRPVAYHGRRFEGLACHGITERGQAVCAAIKTFLPSDQLQALKNAFSTWKSLVRTLNRARDVSAAEISAFEAGALGLCPPLQDIFPWMSIALKLHALAHHAPTFLRRFGSLWAYGDQELEA